MCVAVFQRGVQGNAGIVVQVLLGVLKKRLVRRL
jgi:hypothetical protein